MAMADGGALPIAAAASRLLSSGMIWTRTRTVPLSRKPSCCAAARDRSMIRPRTNGPRSLIRTAIDRPFSSLVTRTMDGIGSVLCAADTAFMSKISPFAVRLP